MRVRSICLTAFLLLIITSASILAQDAPADVNATVSVSAPSENASAPSGHANIRGIWTVSLAGEDITMAVNQSGDSLFGRCKFEGDKPWNGVISGEVSGRIVHIAMAALQGKVLVSTEMSGTAIGDSIKGSYVRSSSDGSAAKGGLTATRISPDTAEYLPAKIEDEAIAATEQASTEQATTKQVQQLGSQTGITQTSASTNRGAFNDVRNLAKGIDPNILPRHAEL